MKISLIGYRASGKSTLGRELSRRLGWPLLDIDRGVEVRFPEETLTEVWLRIGDPRFREIEAEVVEEMCSGDECVVSFGAGTLGRPENRRHACRDALVVYLEMSAEGLWERMQADPMNASTRPNLAGGGFQEVVEMLARRDPVYRECADLLVDASLPTERLADIVIAELEAGLRPPAGSAGQFQR